MITSIKKFFTLLTPGEIRKFYLLIVAMIFMGLTEIVGIGSIAPFLSVASNPSIVQENQYLNWAFRTFEFNSVSGFVIVLGIAVLFFVIIRNITATLVKFTEIRFAEMRGYRLSRRLMGKYLSQPYVFYLNRNSAELSRNILSETTTVINNFLIPLLEMLTRLVTVIAIIIFLVIVDPIVALMVAVLLGLLYGIIYILVKKALFNLGKRRLKANKKRFQLIREVFGGIKDVKLLNKEAFFIDSYAKVAKKTARYDSNRRILGSFPRYALDTLVFGAMIGMVLYIMMSREGDFSESMALLGLYGMGAFRLMPALDGIFKQVAKMRGTQAVVETLYEDLGNVALTEDVSRKEETPEPLPFAKEIKLTDLTFTYPGAESAVINGQSLVIPKNTTIGFAGPTGCGKTTLVDLILGLLTPQSGSIKIDETELTTSEISAWQANLGYVSQSIYLSDDTVARNIAFGIPPAEIDRDKVVQAARIAHLHQFIENELSHGYDTYVGEQGIRLSGGQRQRIGIARALYANPDVLVMDEATSALDGVTETVVMEAIEELAGKKTILLIAHRLTTLRKADIIFLIDKGRIVESGSYENLLASSPRFQKMAQQG